MRLLEALETLEPRPEHARAQASRESRAADFVPQIQKLDLGRLEGRATEQHGRVETERLKVVRAAFGS
jgi:hypothetical protein